MNNAPGVGRQELGAVKSPNDFAWLIEQFVTTVPGISHAIFVSLDGLQLVGSRGVGRDTGDRLAALTAGLLATADQAGMVLGMGVSEYLTVRLPSGHLLFMRVGDSAGLAVATLASCDLRVVAYHMTQFVASVGHLLTPPMRVELQRMTASG
ncbi:roadblock/LC7 domain-containing protein [Actinophytocola sp.]|uniref:roadblock/LC7 domain-containing protein n=1 Tax=Actinophytocola sp. TaxID=1872138 RepID=UPI002D7E4493|nr:roadblock/LC7 domain-containing protein [Actinophytocola sp.]HET9139391.1 roadblock/LC7 domain-containing protein [Actinophytocola sp.]